MFYSGLTKTHVYIKCVEQVFAHKSLLPVPTCPESLIIVGGGGGTQKVKIPSRRKTLTIKPITQKSDRFPFTGYI